MGRKKPTARVEEAPVQQKKNVVVVDDEYSAGTQLLEEVTTVKEEQVVPVGGKKKGKKRKGAQPKGEDDEDGDRNLVEEEEEEEEVSQSQFVGKKSSRSRKGGNIKSSFELLEEEDNDKGESVHSEEESVISFSTEKKPSKPSRKGGNNVAAKSSFELLEDEYNGESEENEPVISFAGRRKHSKGSKKGENDPIIKPSFELLEDEDNEKGDGVESEEDEPAVILVGRKKSSKGSKKGGNSLFSAIGFDVLSDDEKVAESTPREERSMEDANKSENEDDVMALSFTGKKKKSKSGKRNPVSGFSVPNFDALDEAEDSRDENKEANDDNGVIAFTGKKKSSKSSKKSRNLFSSSSLEENGEAEAISEPLSMSKVRDGSSEDDPEDEVEIAFSGKKKSSKKKSAVAFTALEDEAVGAAETRDSSVSASKIERDASPVENKTSEAVIESSKNKKKKKKSGRTAQEEDDLDKILAELGEGPAISKSVHGPDLAYTQEEKVESHTQPTALDVATGAPEGEEEGVVESAAAKKKKKKKEKEKEKKTVAAATAEVKEEKLEEPKNETKRKQKEEQRRLEAMRNQFLAGKEISVSAGENVPPPKRPIYTSKKPKSHQSHVNGAAMAVSNADHLEEEEGKVESLADIDSSELVKVEEGDDTCLGIEVEPAFEKKVDDIQEEEKEEDEEEWDAKSWDDTNIALPVKSAFDDEEAEAEPALIVRKDIKGTVQTTNHDIVSSTGAAKQVTTVTKPISSQPTKVDVTETKQQQNEVVVTSKTKGKVASSSSQSKEGDTDLRSPICCIMGHVDAGKTKLLDCIRGTNVQEGEAGGITQQIGATYFPAENIRQRTKELKADAKLNVPGLLVIDTPGHESFTNLRSRGSGLCDIAILVVDIMDALKLKPQTIESINLLKMRNTEFIVALNKIDRLNGWKPRRNAPFIKTIKEQSKEAVEDFNSKVKEIITRFMEQGLNTALYYKNKEMGETFSLVPTSAISGEGIPDLLLLLVQWTQKTMVEKLTFSDEVQCTVLEVKVIEGHGTTIDVILVNGVLHEGDQIVVCGMQGPIVATIRALLTPHPMKELRVKGTYIHHKEIKAAQGIKITAQGLDHAIAGTGLHVVEPDDDLERIKDLAMEDMQSVMSRIDKSGEGVYVQASTLGSLEALLEFLKSPAVNIPVSGIGIGPVHKKDVMKASVMLEKKKEYATVLAFDVKVTPEAREYAEETGVKIFMADIIYHLFDQFKAYIDNLKEEKKKEAADEAVFPCVLQILPNCIFNKKDPIVLGVDVVEGIAKVGTPICIPAKDFIDIGRIASIENNHKPVDIAKKGQKVAIKIIGANPEEQQKMFGRHFELEDELVSHVSRRSIDVLKANYRDDLSSEEWKLVVKLKILFRIQ
ncbi:hypothetical protein Dimus_016822 [Dionaea muscipula]